MLIAAPPDWVERVTKLLGSHTGLSPWGPGFMSQVSDLKRETRNALCVAHRRWRMPCAFLWEAEEYDKACRYLTAWDGNVLGCCWLFVLFSQHFGREQDNQTMTRQFAFYQFSPSANKHSKLLSDTFINNVMLFVSAFQNHANDHYNNIY